MQNKYQICYHFSEVDGRVQIWSKYLQRYWCLHTRNQTYLLSIWVIIDLHYVPLSVNNHGSNQKCLARRRRLLAIISSIACRRYQQDLESQGLVLCEEVGTTRHHGVKKRLARRPFFDEGTSYDMQTEHWGGSLPGHASRFRWRLRAVIFAGGALRHEGRLTSSRLHSCVRISGCF